MNLDDLRALVETDLPGPALQVLLAAASEDVDERLGAIGPVVEATTPHGPLFGLARAAVEILEVTERGQVLDPTDYALRPSGTVLVRQGRASWAGRTEVKYQPRADGGRRNRAIAALVRLELTHKPGLTGVRFGSWSEQYSQQGGTYETEREAILTALLDDTGVMM